MQIQHHQTHLNHYKTIQRNRKADEEDQDYSETQSFESHPKMRNSEENDQKVVRKKVEAHWTMDIKSELEAIQKLPLCCK